MSDRSSLDCLFLGDLYKEDAEHAGDNVLAMLQVDPTFIKSADDRGTLVWWASKWGYLSLLKYLLKDARTDLSYNDYVAVGVAIFNRRLDVLDVLLAEDRLSPKTIVQGRNVFNAVVAHCCGHVDMLEHLFSKWPHFCEDMTITLRIAYNTHLVNVFEYIMHRRPFSKADLQLLYQACGDARVAIVNCMLADIDVRDILTSNPEIEQSCLDILPATEDGERIRALFLARQFKAKQISACEICGELMVGDQTNSETCSEGCAEELAKLDATMKQCVEDSACDVCNQEHTNTQARLQEDDEGDGAQETPASYEKAKTPTHISKDEKANPASQPPRSRVDLRSTRGPGLLARSRVRVDVHVYVHHVSE